jgi:hypothetical protein
MGTRLSVEKHGLEGNEKRGDTLKCPFRGEADDRAECPPFFLLIIMGGPQAPGASL